MQRGAPTLTQRWRVCICYATGCAATTAEFTGCAATTAEFTVPIQLVDDFAHASNCVERYRLARACPEACVRVRVRVRVRLLAAACCLLLRFPQIRTVSCFSKSSFKQVISPQIGFVL
jgi:hypothetical protein